MRYTFILFLLFFVTAVSADDGGFGGEDFGSDLGGVAVGLMALGTGYIIIRRGLPLLKSVLSKDKYNEVFAIYRKVRPYLFASHVWLNLGATFFALLHGLSLLSEGRVAVWTGGVALAAMILASIVGTIIWLRFRPIWGNKDARKFLRLLHRQWLLSGIIVVSLFFHLVIGGD